MTSDSEFLSNAKIKRILLLLFWIIVMFSAIQNMNVILSFVKKVFDIVFPFIVGACMAFVINIPMKKIESLLFKKNPNFKGKRIISYAISLILIIGVLVLAMFVIIPELVNTIKQLGKQIPIFATQLEAILSDLAVKYPAINKVIGNVNFDTTNIVNKLLELTKGSSKFVASTVNIVSSVAHGFITFFIGFSFSIYAVLYKETLIRQIKKMLYAFFKTDVVEKLLGVGELTNRTFSNFITGQCLEACILGSMFFVTMSIIGMPYALLIAILITLTALIPIFGAFIGCAVGALLIFIKNPTHPLQAVAFIIMFLILQYIEGNFIYPHVVGNSVGLPSIWVLVAVTVGGDLMGIIGMLVFIPLCSVIYSIIRGLVNERLKQKDLKKEVFTSPYEELRQTPIPAEGMAEQPSETIVEAAEKSDEKATKASKKAKAKK